MIWLGLCIAGMPAAISFSRIQRTFFCWRALSSLPSSLAKICGQQEAKVRRQLQKLNCLTAFASNACPHEVANLHLWSSSNKVGKNSNKIYSTLNEAMKNILHFACKQADMLTQGLHVYTMHTVFNQNQNLQNTSSFFSRKDYKKENI